ncbi:MAG TPA: transposase [Pseudolabrys sp.]|jgi:transposase|nr:transposase [Pseudolabrys sp.]
MDFEREAPDEQVVEGFAGRLEVIEGPSGRRSWPDDVKAQIVRESLEPEARVSEVARRHRISPQQLTLWRRAAREGRLSAFSGAEKAEAAAFVPLAITAEPGSVTRERIVIEMNGITVSLPAETAAKRIAEIVLALDARL